MPLWREQDPGRPPSSPQDCLSEAMTLQFHRVGKTLGKKTRGIPGEPIELGLRIHERVGGDGFGADMVVAAIEDAQELLRTTTIKSASLSAVQLP